LFAIKTSTESAIAQYSRCENLPKVQSSQGKEPVVCFSATVNFVGSAALDTAGLVTLTTVKHRRELLFAALPLLFAIHQFVEGFVWLGSDGVLSPAVAHDMGAAFMHNAQRLLPFLAPLSILLFEPNSVPTRQSLA
jgi:hypothetical protein